MVNPLLDIHDAVHGLVAGGYEYRFAMREFERLFLAFTLTTCKGNQCKAARKMGMHRNTLRRKLALLDRAPIRLLPEAK